MRSPRRRYVCTDCGLRIEGRLNASDGRVYPYDRSPTDTSVPPAPCLCITCAEKRPC